MIPADYTAVMWRVCSRCRVELGARPCVPAMAGKVSHGYCKRCVSAMRAPADGAALGEAVPARPLPPEGVVGLRSFFMEASVVAEICGVPERDIYLLKREAQGADEVELFFTAPALALLVGELSVSDVPGHVHGAARLFTWLGQWDWRAAGSQAQDANVALRAAIDACERDEARRHAAAVAAVANKPESWMARWERAHE